MEFIIKENIDELIQQASEKYESENEHYLELALDVLRTIKEKFINFEKKNWKEISHSDEFKILNEYKEECINNWEKYKDEGKWNYANKENIKLEIISRIVPEQPSEEDLIVYIKEVANQNNDSKSIFSKVKEKYPYISGKLIGELIKKCDILS